MKVWHEMLICILCFCFTHLKRPYAHIFHFFFSSQKFCMWNLFFDLKQTKLWFETKTFVNEIDFSVRVYGKEGGKPDLVLVVEANDLAKLKEKILVGIGTVRTLLYVPQLIDGTKSPCFCWKNGSSSSIWQFWITFYVCDKFFIGRTNVS